MARRMTVTPCVRWIVTFTGAPKRAHRVVNFLAACRTPARHKGGNNE